MMGASRIWRQINFSAGCAWRQFECVLTLASRNPDAVYIPHAPALSLSFSAEGSYRA